MADNVEFQSTITATPNRGIVVAALEIGGVLYQRMIDSFDNVLYYYDGSGNLEYLCWHPDPDAETSATDWRITKQTYGANGITSRVTRSGSVDGRVALFA